jgi:hypothetical protein
VTDFWEAKYKTCRMAFLETVKLHRKETKMLRKELQRTKQKVFDMNEALAQIYKYSGEEPFKSNLKFMAEINVLAKEALK